MKEIYDLQNDRGLIVDQMKTLADKVEGESRDFSASEQQEYDSLFSKQESLKNRIQRHETINGNLEGLNAAGSRGTSTMPDTQHLSGLKDESWKDSMGNNVPVYAKGENVFTNRGKFEGANLGSMMKAMVMGTDNPAIRNALSEGTDSAGGFSVPEPLYHQAIDVMRNKTRVVSAGAQTVMLSADKLNMARVTSDLTPAWRAENAAVAESATVFDNVQFVAKSHAVLIKVSRELLEDSINIEAVLMNQFAQQMALSIDYAALMGDGTSNSPTGVFSQSGVQSKSLGTNGAALTLADLRDSLQLLSEANSEPPTAAIMAPRTFYDIDSWADTTNQPLILPKSLSSLPMLETNQIPIDQTQGTETAASTILLGDFTQLMIGMRSAVRIEVLRETFAGNLQYGFLCHMRADIQLAHPASFVKIIGVAAS
jgi:HK97 family phage major capsid protein